MITTNDLTELQKQLYTQMREQPRPVPQLMSWLLDRRNLDAAWDRISATDGANTPGVDGETCDGILNHLDCWLNQIADDLLHDRYRPLPPRMADIPKTSGRGTRRIGILRIRDRLVHAAVKQVLEPILDPLFLPTSFGFRPGRSVAAALDAAGRLALAEDGHTLAFPWASHLDVADCFDTIDHQLLMEDLSRQIADTDLLRLLSRTLGASGVTAGLFWRRRRGVVQGSSLSPLLCNLYLHPLDQTLAEISQRWHDGVRLLRYADDLLLLARTSRLGHRAIAQVRRVLRMRRQRLRGPIHGPGLLSDGVEWLGVVLRPRRNPWTGDTRVGYLVRDEKVREMLQRIDEITAPPSERIDPAAFDLARWLVSVNDQLRDWRQVYQYADNAAEVFATLDDHARQRVGRLLASVTGLRPNRLAGRYGCQLPRGFFTWQIDGARLTVLSSLAPRRPRRLIHPPAWLNGKQSRHRVRSVNQPARAASQSTSVQEASS